MCEDDESGRVSRSGGKPWRCQAKWIETESKSPYSRGECAKTQIFQNPSAEACLPKWRLQQQETLSGTGDGAHTPGQETQVTPLPLSPKTCTCCPSFEGSPEHRELGWPWAWSVDQHSPTPSHSDPHGGTHYHPPPPSSGPPISTGKRESKNKARARVCTTRLDSCAHRSAYFGLSLPSDKAANSLLSASRWKCAPAWLGLSLCQGYKQPLSFSRTE